MSVGVIDIFPDDECYREVNNELNKRRSVVPNLYIKAIAGNMDH